MNVNYYDEGWPSGRTIERVSQTLEQPIGVFANLVDSEFRLSILSCGTASNILLVDSPGHFLATIADAPGLVSGPCL
ncbi:hypothetical protein, partial [Staphylococcus aureus]